MNTDIVARLLCAALTFYIPITAVLVPYSVPGQVLHHEGVSFWPTYVLMFAIASFICIDVVVNKMCPYKNCRIELLEENREVLFIGAAFCALVIPFSASKTNLDVDGVAGFLYLLIFSGSLALSWCDAFNKRGVSRAAFL